MTTALDALREILSRGPMPASTANAAMKAAGYSERQTRRAREALGIKPGMGARSVWRLDQLCPVCHRPWPGTDQFGEGPDGAISWAPSGGMIEVDERTPSDERAALGEVVETEPRWRMASPFTTCSQCGRQTTLPKGSSCFYLGRDGRPCKGVMR